MADFYVRGNEVLKHNEPGVLDDGDAQVALAHPDIEGAAEQIAHALNRLPEADALVLRLVQAIRGADAAELVAAADAAEDWMVNGQ